MKRTLVNIILLLSIIFFPPYVSGLCVLVAIFICENFIESIFWAFLIDTIYSGGRVFGFAFPYIFTLVTIITYATSERLKSMFRI